MLKCQQQKKDNMLKKVILKGENAIRIINIARTVKTEKWSHKDLLIVLSKLKNGKCRDPGGIINEIFKPGVIGSDLQEALLDLLNLCKSEMQIPNFMQTANISAAKGTAFDCVFRSNVLPLHFW